MASVVLDMDEEYVCHEASHQELQTFEQIAFWLDGVVQIGVGVVGVLGNSVAIPVLMSRRLNSVFNKILVFLAIFDNVYLLCALLEAIRKHVAPLGPWHIYLFAHFAFQLQSFGVLSSIFMTVVLALERYLAITRPIEYHNAIQGTNPWRRVANYVVPVVILSAAFNAPKFLEVQVVHVDVITPTWDESREQLVNLSESVGVATTTELRMDADYVFWYNNLAKLLITGAVPFVSLCVFNTAIYKALKRRRQTSGGAVHEQQWNEDRRQSVLLFAIVVIFFVSNAPRIIINIHEVFNIEQYRLDLQHGCKSLTFGVLLLGTVSQLLMVVNSSTNFFLYCLMSTVFREVLVDALGCGKTRNSNTVHKVVARDHVEHEEQAL